MPGYHWLPDPLKLRLLAWEGAEDAARLRARLPDLSRRLAAAEAWLPEIRRTRLDWLEREATDPAMSLSLETARFTIGLCEVLRPAAAADLGSGLSSWLLRWWARRTGHRLHVVSVDDAPRWLDRARSFVEASGLPAEEFRTWSQFRDGDRRFDLVLWDFGDVRARAEATGEIWERVAPGGALLFDDIHKARLWRAARGLRRRHRDRLEGYSLREWTRDRYGRFAWLALDRT